MANIAGIYTISAPLNAQYTLTGADRNAAFSINAPDAPLNLSCTSCGYASYVAAMYDTSVKIKRARLVSAGAPGLQRNEQAAAGSFVLAARALDENLNYQTLDSVVIKFGNWNEWQNVDFDLRPYKTACNFSASQINQHKPVDLFALYQNSGFHCDDYNLQAAYIGETFTPVLELEIETAGMVEKSQYTII